MCTCGLNIHIDSKVDTKNEAGYHQSLIGKHTWKSLVKCSGMTFWVISYVKGCIRWSLTTPCLGYSFVVSGLDGPNIVA